MLREMTAFALALAACVASANDGARPVWHAGHEREVNEQLLFRGRFASDGAERPVLRFASSNPCRVRLNGAFAWYGPARGPKGFFRVDEVPLDAKPGVNELEIECAGYNCASFYFQKQPSFLKAEVSSGGRTLLRTDAKEGPSFFAASPAGRVKDARRYSHARTFCEIYEYPAVGTPLPLAVQPEIAELSRRAAVPDFFTVADDFREVSDGFYVAPVNRTGFPALSVNCIEPGALKLEFDEYPVDGDFKPGRSKVNNEIVWRFSAKGRYEVAAFEPYVLMAARVTALSGKFVWSAPRLRLYRNAESRRASFESSDPALDRLFAAAEETFAQNAVDGFMDCPGRERAGWNCDAFFTARANVLLTGNVSQETLFLENFALPPHFDNVARGMIPMCYPSDFATGNYIPSWAMFFVLQLDEYVRLRGGERALAERLRPRVFALVEFLRRYRNAEGLLENLPRWVFVEWSKANDFVKGVNYPNNMIWAATLDAVDRLYGRPDLAAEADRMRGVIRKRSFDGSWFRDQALRAPDGSLSETQESTETCQYYAFYFGVATKELYPDLHRRLTVEFGPNRMGRGLYPRIWPSAPFIGNFMRLDWLGREGLVAKEISEMKGYFGYMADRTGTIWENADSADNGSCCHGFASHVAVFVIRDLVGVKSIDSANRRIDVRPPADAPVAWCRLKIPVDGDVLTVGWRREGEAVSVQLPEGWRK